MIYEPGPFAIRSPMPLGPRVVSPNLFLGDVVAIQGTIAAVEQGWGASVSVIAPLAARSLDADYNNDVVPAFTNLDLFDTPAENAQFAAIAGAADGAITDATHQLLDLPGLGENPPSSIDGGTPDPGDLPGTE
jgi:hypothetical protein